ncbi:MAG: malonyl-ACP O-methyltransferase BioC [Steroidobacteraceae bacterium]|jgi:malonyl-CoA O-methyltransferase|nr:malonyl-ACP O-methyltransferase BioC [Steroidobacteraceae bacterium]
MPPAEPDDYYLDPRSVRRAFDAAASTYQAADAAPGEIRSRLLERLDVVRLEPKVVLDLGAGDGAATRALKQRYPSANVIALDISERMLRAAARRQRLFRRFHRVAADAQRLPLRDASVDLAFSNLALEWCASPDAVFKEVRRTLRPNGLFTFTTLGPDTLKEVREAWRSVDSGVHIHRFIDMHDLGDALIRARFAEPVMDVERLTITYPDLSALLRELRSGGAANLAHGRRRALTGVHRWRAFERHARAAARDGALPVSVEVVYGHAWAGEVRAPRGPAGEFRVPAAVLKRRTS